MFKTDYLLKFIIINTILTSIASASDLDPLVEAEGNFHEYHDLNATDDIDEDLNVAANPSKFVNIKRPFSDPTGFLPLDSVKKLSPGYLDKEKVSWQEVKEFTQENEKSTVILMLPGFIFPGAGFRLGVEELFDELSNIVLKNQSYDESGAVVVGINSFLWHIEKQSSFDESRLTEASLAQVITKVSREIVGTENKLIVVTHSLSARAAVNGAIKLIDSSHIATDNLGLVFLAPHAVPTIPIVGRCLSGCLKREPSFDCIPFQAVWEMLFKRPLHIPEPIQSNSRFIFPSGENVAGKFSSRNFKWLLGCWQKKCDNLTESDPSTVFEMFNCDVRHSIEVDGCHIGIFNDEEGLEKIAFEINNIFAEE